MSRIIILAMLIVPTTLHAADWEPPENPNPGAILQEAQNDARKGDYKTSLEKHVWYHQNALKHDEGQQGVRLSFALMYWNELGEKYPPAIAQLRKIRDEAGESVRRGKGKQEDLQQAFHDFSAINDRLKEQSKTADLFLELDKQKSKFAAEAYHFAQAALLNAKEYEVCGRYVDPDREFKRLAQVYEITAAMGKGKKNAGLVALANDTLTSGASSLVALLTVADKKEKAAEIAKSAKELRDDANYHRSIDEALEGKFPKSAVRFP
jgi:hypothetical protein